MIIFCYVVPEDETGFTNYFEETLDIFSSGVMKDGVIKFGPELF